MQTAIIIHGMPSKEEYYDPRRRSTSRGHWIAWLQRQLILKEILTQTPEMPEPYAPVYEKWSEVFGQYAIDKDTILIGHSYGAGFLLRYLSEHTLETGKVILVAPWLDPHNELGEDIFSCTIDEKLKEKSKDVIVVYSLDDDQEIIDSSLKIIGSIKNVVTKVFTDKGHFTYGEMGTSEFPELLEICLN